MCIKIDQFICSPRGMIHSVLLSPQGVSGLPFLSLPLIPPSYYHLQPLRMSRAHIFSDAHEIVGGTFYTADTVSGRARYPLSKLITQISGRCTSTTSTITIRQHLMGSFPLCQTPAIGSQGIQKSLPNL